MKINRMNPAEYFASLGVLELLSHQDADLLSHFEGEGNLVDFYIASEKDITMPDLRQFKVEALPHRDTGIAPVRFGTMQLDWWLDVYNEEKSLLKCWGGTATPESMLNNYKSLLQSDFSADSLTFKAETRVKSCFNLDTRSSRDPLQAGYSRNDAKEEAVLYPFCELLVAIGLQNFRPASAKRALQYFTWSRPIRVNIAHAACRMNIAGLRSEGFEINFEKVGQLKEVSRVVSLQQSSSTVV